MRGIPAGTWPGHAGNGGGGSGTWAMAAAAPRPLFSLPRQAGGRFRALNVPRRRGRGAARPIPPGSWRRETGPGGLAQRPGPPSLSDSARFQLKGSNLE